mgnify:CR=1 FL=1
MSSNSTADQLKEKGSIILQKTGTVAKQGFDKASTLTKQGITQGMDFGKSEVKLSGWSIYVIGGVILTLFILVFVFVNTATILIAIVSTHLILPHRTHA